MVYEQISIEELALPSNKKEAEPSMPSRYGPEWCERFDTLLPGASQPIQLYRSIRYQILLQKHGPWRHPAFTRSEPYDYRGGINTAKG